LADVLAMRYVLTPPLVGDLGSYVFSFSKPILISAASCVYFFVLYLYFTLKTFAALFSGFLVVGSSRGSGSILFNDALSVTVTIQLRFKR
jgi:hypothetical protein